MSALIMAIHRVSQHQLPVVLIGASLPQLVGLAGRSKSYAERLGLKVQSTAPLRAGLIGKGMIFSPAHGDTEFTVPLFNEFMLRTMPEWER